MSIDNIDAAVSLVNFIFLIGMVWLNHRQSKLNDTLVTYLKTARKMISVMSDSLSCIAVNDKTINPKAEALDALMSCSRIVRQERSAK